MNFKKIITLGSLVFLVNACAYMQNPEPEVKRYQEPRFNHEMPIALKVNKIKVVSEFVPSFTRPNLEHLFPVSIERTARLWAEDRLEAVDFSSDKIAEFIIKDASVTEEMEVSENIIEKDRIIYRANLYVVLKIYDPQNLSKAETEIEAWRELRIPADSDVAEKEKYWYGMVDKLFDTFNVNMEKNINQYLNMYVDNSDSIQTYD